MGRDYAGVLGLLAFTTVMLRGAIEGSEADVTLKWACLLLFAFATMGYVVGRLADWTISDGLRSKLNQQLRAEAEAKSKANAEG